MAVQRIEIASQSDVSAVTFADESQVVGGYSDGAICRWKIEDGQQQGSTMQASGRVYSIAVSKDRQWVVSGDQGRKAIIWNAATHETVFQFAEHPDYVLGVDVSSDSIKVAWVDYYAAHTSSISSGTQLLPPLSHSRVVDIKFCPDGTQFATASYAQGVRVYCARTGAILFDSGSKGSTGCWPAAPLAWSSDGRQLFVAVQGKITCFNVSGSSSSEWPIHESQSRPSMASTGRFIACSAGSSVSLWDCLSHKQIGNIITHTSAITSIALSPSGAYLACGNGRNITIHYLRNICPPEYFDSGLPLIRVSDKIFQSWSQDDPRNTEMLLLEEITSASSPAQYLLANRALVRVHLKHLALAVEDAKEERLWYSCISSYPHQHQYHHYNYDDDPTDPGDRCIQHICRWGRVQCLRRLRHEIV
ncbi:hypothetical protein PISMIDRAFT_403765 [Pisolithus microcarpus 441]|uniref:Uncharacterized protein n=1 Tax=Pisolithus microcarpus 441 TaxID=765257 RepID=A0A0C9ZY32_9AGAM|nr:hypothetical protein PISMIDRAFT_403765 [Pisolithus microcarpus 441]